MVFRHTGEVAGVLPCFLHPWNGLRQLTLVGSGVSDFLDPLFEPGWVSDIVQCLRRELQSRTDWDVCNWQDLSRDTPLTLLGTVLDETPCSAIDLSQPFDAFQAERPKDLKRNLRRYRSKAEAIASVTFEVTENADSELMDALVRLHSARWAVSGQSGMIAANRSEAFLRQVAELFAANGWLRVFTVRFGARIAAILLAFRDNEAIYSYLSAFDPEYEQFGFGRELLAQAIRYAHEHGYRRWEFLRGDEPYKFSWGAQVIPKCRVVIRS